MDADVWLTVGKIALLSFLVLGPATVVITYLRRSRSGVSGWRPPNGSQYPDALGGGAPSIPSPDERPWEEVPHPNEQAVLLDWDYDVAADQIDHAEEVIAATLTSRRIAGEVDGNEVGGGATRIYLYGPDCHALWSAIDSVVRALPQPPTSAVLRPGGPGSPSRTVTL
ncbi:hypothetical protein [Mycolicibacterium fluoranthenivorans]|jgi:hypothetical protein|nr:hypothetical protein [Mycolicibacterium fluoranthenivorans]